MPRPRVKAHERRRVSRACDICRKRKEKCDGNFPCKHCASRNGGAGCRYTAGIARRSNLRALWTHRPTASPSPSRQTNSGSLDSIETLLGPPPALLSPTETTSLDCAQIPKQSRLLGDGRGKSFYIGESGSISYLEIVRRSVADVIGSCIFADDPLQHQMYEKEVGKPLGTHLEPELQPELEWCQDLVEQFQLQVSGTVDLFDASWIQDKLPQWVSDHNRRDRPESPVIFLVLAIGILSRASSGRTEAMAENYFNYGRQLAFMHLVDEPSLLTVQTFCLIAYYMMASCRGNGAFTHLGIATRAAYALGIHRHETNSAFAREAGIERERAWKSLRVCDLFLSASMGRPPATSEADCNVTDATPQPTKDRSNALASCQVSSAIFRICLVFEQILVEVYSKRVVSLDLAASISQQHRLWAAELPSILKIDGLSKDQADVNAPTQKLGSRIVTMAYYYSIILLSRPFLSVHVGAHQAQVSGKQYIDRIPDNVSTYADACVNSAFKGIALANEIALDGSMPRRQPLIINSVFVSALALGHAHLADYDQQGWPIGSSLDTAIAILRHYSPGNPHSARYHDICCRLKDAVGLYAQKRAEAFLKLTTRHVTDIFGDVQQDDCQGRREWPTNTPPRYPCGEGYDKTDHSETAHDLRRGNLSPVSLTAADRHLAQQVDGVQSMGRDGIRSRCSTGVLSPFTMDDFAFTEDVPLFSFMGRTDVGMYHAD